MRVPVDGDVRDERCVLLHVHACRLERRATACAQVPQDSAVAGCVAFVCCLNSASRAVPASKAFAGREQRATCAHLFDLIPAL
jgi:hypothetical protein